MCHGKLCRCSSLLGDQVPQREIIHNILNLLDTVLYAIASPSQRVILEVQDLEARMQILDELADL